MRGVSAKAYLHGGVIVGAQQVLQLVIDLHHERLEALAQHLALALDLSGEGLGLLQDLEDACSGPSLR